MIELLNLYEMNKKLLILCTALGAFSFANGQSLQSENFNSLTLGNVGTDITGATAGQSGLFTFASNGTAPTTSTNAANSLFQIVSSGNASKGMSITGPNGNAGSAFVWKSGLATSWTGRTAGNNIIEVEVDVYLGALSTSVNKHGIRIFDAAGTKTLVGFQVNTATGELQLIAYSTPTANPVGNYSYALVAAPGVILPPNSWSRIGISYNKTTNACTIKGPGVPANTILAGSSANADPDEVDFVVTSGHSTTIPNTAAGTIIFDNLTVKASATDTLLGNDNFTTNGLTVTMYPNPASDILNIQSETEVLTKVSITDLNGRVVKEVSNNLSQISLENLAKGIYMVTIESATAKKVEKLIVE